MFDDIAYTNKKILTLRCRVPRKMIFYSSRFLAMPQQLGTSHLSCVLFSSLPSLFVARIDNHCHKRWMQVKRGLPLFFQSVCQCVGKTYSFAIFGLRAGTCELQMCMAFGLALNISVKSIF